MNLDRHYQSLYETNLKIVQQEGFRLDPFLKQPAIDERRGITLLVRPDHPTKASIQHFLEALEKVAPNQYYYPKVDLHITVLAIISCYAGFQLTHIQPKDYISIIKDCLKDLPSFKIQMRGISISKSTIIIQGFYPVGTLDKIRDNLRAGFQNSGLEQSIDKRYKLQTAHATAVRFKTPQQNKDELLQLLAQYRDYSFGTFDVHTLDFVFNDWYQRTESAQLLEQFSLGSSNSI